MVKIIFPDIKPSSMLFENILSMSVFECRVFQIVLRGGGTRNFAGGDFFYTGGGGGGGVFHKEFF